MNGKNRIPAQLVLVEIDRKYKSIYNLTIVCSLKITTVLLKLNDTLIQCHKCQSYTLTAILIKTRLPNLNAHSALKITYSTRAQNQRLQKLNTIFVWVPTSPTITNDRNTPFNDKVPKTKI